MQESLSKDSEPFQSLQNQTLDNKTQSQEHDDTQTGEVQGQDHQDVSEQTVVPGVGHVLHRRRRKRRRLGHLTVNPRPALVALAGELVFHVQDVVVVQMATDVEARASQARVAADAEEPGVEVEVGDRKSVV